LWGQPLALIVDHGIRLESRAESEATSSVLARLNIESQILRVTGLQAGPGLQSRARQARYAALIEAVRLAGLSDLLLGHHAGDQAETVAIRQSARSGPAGLAGMAAILHTASLRMVRPLLGIPPASLRATLRARGIGWIEDPSNRNLVFERARIRQDLADGQIGDSKAVSLVTEAQKRGLARDDDETRIAATLAACVAIYPEGYALLTPGPIDPDALGALIRALTGAPYPPGRQSLPRAAAGFYQGTLGGMRFMQAGRLGPGTLLVREAAAMQAPIEAVRGCLWDRRFRLDAPAEALDSCSLGALGDDASAFGKASRLPEAVRRTLPALRDHAGLVAVPHLGYFCGWTNGRVRLTFSPSVPAAGAPFRVFGLGDAQPDRAHHVPDEAGAGHLG
jgi:tRNA(Ile)-lysidine synthase